MSRHLSSRGVIHVHTGTVPPGSQAYNYLVLFIVVVARANVFRIRYTYTLKQNECNFVHLSLGTWLCEPI